MKLDVAVVSHGTDFHLLHLLRSLAAAFPAGDLGLCHVWDNASRDATPRLLELLAAELPWLRVQRSEENFQHGPALDRLLREHCRADWVLVLDSDTRVLRDFRPALPSLAAEPAFVGQIHPEPAQLYAYLCHLLLHRPQYLELPPFVRHGAPGLAFFRAVEERGLPWRRFRFSDHVEHYGQATLRGVAARGEVENEHYAWAARVARESPAAAGLEAALRRELEAWLAERGAAPPRAAPAPAPPARPRREPLALRVRRRARATAHAALLHPRARALPPAALLAAARGIGLPPPHAAWRALHAQVRALAPRRVLEVGGAHGGSFFLWTRAAAPDATLVSLGLPPWELDDPGEPARRAALARFAGARQRVRVLRLDPLAPEALEALKQALGGAPLDFLFVAAADTPERRAAIEARFAPWLRPGGLLAHAPAVQRAAAPGCPGQYGQRQ